MDVLPRDKKLQSDKSEDLTVRRHSYGCGNAKDQVEVKGAEVQRMPQMGRSFIL
jgi:hypothetical protein